jgi:ABC-type Na+ transport system ATPase subunit NatA
MVGLDRVAGRRAGAYSLGMRQRLGIAAALLGDPGVLIFDEPVNGLDPDGIRWVRQLVKDLAAEGRTVFVSSHLMSEMENTADRLVVIGCAGSSPMRRSARSSPAAPRRWCGSARPRPPSWAACWHPPPRPSGRSPTPC